MGRPPYLDDSFPATKTQGTKECKIPEGSPNRTRSSMRTKRARTNMARMMRLGSCSRSFSACCIGGGYRSQRRRGKEVVSGFPRAGAGGQPRGLPLRVGRGDGVQRQLSGDSLDSGPIGVRGRPIAGMPRGWSRYAKVSAKDGVTGRAGCAGARRRRRLGPCQLVGRQWRIIPDDSADYALGGGCPSEDSNLWELHICVPTPLTSRWKPGCSLAPPGLTPSAGGGGSNLAAPGVAYEHAPART